MPILSLNAINRSERLHRMGEMSKLEKANIYIFANVILLFAILSSGCGRNAVKEAKELVKNRKFNEAILILKQDNSPTALFLLGKIQLRLNQPINAFKSFDKAVRESPQYKKLVVAQLLNFAHSMDEGGKDYLASKAYEKILSLDENLDLGMGYKTLGEWYYNKEEYEKAIPLLQKALFVSQKNDDIRLMLIRANMKMGNMKDALNIAEEGMRISNNWQFRYLVGNLGYILGKMYYKDEKYNDALLMLSKTIAIGLPEVLKDDAYFLMGKIHFNEKDYKEAEACFKKVIELNPFTKGKIVREAQERLNVLKEMEVNK